MQRTSEANQRGGSGDPPRQLCRGLLLPQQGNIVRLPGTHLAQQRLRERSERSLLTLLTRRYVLGVIYAFMKSGGSDKITPMLSNGGVSPITKQASGWYVLPPR